MTRATTVLGVSIDGFAVEGGYDADAAPFTSFNVAQSLGRVAPSTRTAGTFAHLEDLVDRAAALGCTELRLTMEWARLEPRPDVHDDEALARYQGALRAAQRASMTSVVVLCDVALPSWMGQEPWLSGWAPERFAKHAGWVAARVDGLAHRVVTLRAPNRAADDGWRTGRRPPFRVGAARDALAALDGMLVAHQLALDAIAEVAPELGRAILMETGDRYVDAVLWHDVASGIGDPVLLAARADRFDADRRGHGPRLHRGLERLAEVPTLRSTPRWKDAGPFEWWFAGVDAPSMLATAAFCELGPTTMELGAGRAGWAEQLATGLPELLAARGSVHLHGLVASTGPLDAPTGLVDVEQHNGAWRMAALDDALAATLRSLQR